MPLLFNQYKLNSNYTTYDGINLTDPTFRISQLIYDDSRNEHRLVLKWKDNTQEIERVYPTHIYGVPQESETIPEFLESQLLQIPIFSESTLVE